MLALRVLRVRRRHVRRESVVLDYARDDRGIGLPRPYRGLVLAVHRGGTVGAEHVYPRLAVAVRQVDALGVYGALHECCEAFTVGDDDRKLGAGLQVVVPQRRKVAVDHGHGIADAVGRHMPRRLDDLDLDRRELGLGSLVAQDDGTHGLVWLAVSGRGS
jgi:hypothetical protein